MAYASASTANASRWPMRIERGPDWLFVRLESPAEAPPAAEAQLAEGIWEALRENHAHRVLLELDEAGPIDDCLIEAIAQLGRRVRAEGGMIRLCGLSQPDLRTLRARGATPDIAHFGSRAEAVGASRAGSM